MKKIPTPLKEILLKKIPTLLEKILLTKIPQKQHLMSSQLLGVNNPGSLHYSQYRLLPVPHQISELPNDGESCPPLKIQGQLLVSQRMRRKMEM